MDGELSRDYISYRSVNMFAFPVKAHFNTGTHFRVQPQVVSRGTAGNWEQYGKPQQHHDSFRAAFMAHCLNQGF